MYLLYLQRASPTMPGVTDPEITFVRLTEIDLDTVTALLNEPRNARHLPLSHGDTFTAETAAAWVASKDGQWDEHASGPGRRPLRLPARRRRGVRGHPLPSVPAHPGGLVGTTELLTSWSAGSHS